MGQIDEFIQEKYKNDINNIRDYIVSNDKLLDMRFINRDDKKILQYLRSVHVQFIHPQRIGGNYFSNDYFDIWLDVPLVEEK